MQLHPVMRDKIARAIREGRRQVNLTQFSKEQQVQGQQLFEEKLSKISLAEIFRRKIHSHLSKNGYNPDVLDFPRQKKPYSPEENSLYLQLYSEIIKGLSEEEQQKYQKQRARQLVQIEISRGGADARMPNFKGLSENARQLGIAYFEMKIKTVREARNVARANTSSCKNTESPVCAITVSDSSSGSTQRLMLNKAHWKRSSCYFSAIDHDAEDNLNRCKKLQQQSYFFQASFARNSTKSHFPKKELPRVDVPLYSAIDHDRLLDQPPHKKFKIS